MLIQSVMIDSMIGRILFLRQYMERRIRLIGLWDILQRKPKIYEKLLDAVFILNVRSNLGFPPATIFDYFFPELIINMDCAGDS